METALEVALEADTRVSPRGETIIDTGQELLADATAEVDPNIPVDDDTWTVVRRNRRARVDAYRNPTHTNRRLEQNVVGGASKIHNVQLSDRFPRDSYQRTTGEKGTRSFQVEGGGSKAGAIKPALCFGKGSAPISWSSIVASPAKGEDLSLEYVLPMEEEGKLYATISNAEIEAAADHWKATLVAYVLGDKPFYQQMKGYALRTWKPKCNLEVYSRDNGFFMFKFEKEEECQRILN